MATAVETEMKKLTDIAVALARCDERTLAMTTRLLALTVDIERLCVLPEFEAKRTNRGQKSGLSAVGTATCLPGKYRQGFRRRPFPTTRQTAADNLWPLTRAW